MLNKAHTLNLPRKLPHPPSRALVAASLRDSATCAIEIIYLYGYGHAHMLATAVASHRTKIARHDKRRAYSELLWERRK